MHIPFYIHVISAGNLTERGFRAVVHPLEGLRIRVKIVAVHKGDEFAPGFLHSQIPGRAGALIFLTNDLNAAVPGGVFLYNRRRRIRGAIVNTQNLNPFQRLAQDAVQAFSQKAFAVIDRHNNGYRWFVHMVFTPCMGDERGTVRVRSAFTRSCIIAYPEKQHRASTEVRCCCVY